MAFFEQLGKKLTDAGQGVAQQIKNFADVTRLNSEISDKEKKINELLSFCKEEEREYRFERGRFCVNAAKTVGR